MKSVYFPASGTCVLTHTLAQTLACTLVILLTACSSGMPKKDDPGPAPARDLSSSAGEAGELFTKARESLDKGKFDTAVLEYENLEATYPFGDHAAQARLDVAYAYYQQGELDNSLATLDRYLKLYPQSEQADYAHYLKGLVNYSRGKYFFESIVPRKMDQLDQAWLRASLADFETLERRFPDSRFLEEAASRKLRLIDHMARHELNTAKYYFTRSAMVAVINRVNSMFEQYPNSTVTPEGLVLLARAHRALGDQRSADEASALLRERYPDFTRI